MPVLNESRRGPSPFSAHIPQASHNKNIIQCHILLKYLHLIKIFWRKLMSFSENFYCCFNVKFILMVAKRPTNFQSHLIEEEFIICCSLSVASAFQFSRKDDGKNVLKICQSEEIVAERFMTVITIKGKTKKNHLPRREWYWNEEFISLIVR